ncbi:GSCFA domain-containing protein [Sphingobium yanoikuyae]|uniref:GSCFA domain-containing protein n=1 Tax=Sphingobium yanoikuyae TaxID=13690 RepID=UPI001376DA3D|nr:GSCFA domain-containing protein [Sphingobium yanoikuyae]NBB37628.1 hypothetical protein [Sphingobium yanoikuyae]
MIETEVDGIKRKTHRTYSNRVSPHPDDNSLTKDYVVDRYMTRGFMPEEPFVKADTPIVAFGSCFASNISNYLHARKYTVLTKQENKAYVTTMGDGMTHTYAVLQQFQWAWENKFPTTDLWHGYNAEEFGYNEDARLDTKRLFDAAEVFIITLGLSEIWYDEPTGEVFWRAPPKDKMDPERHKFRVASFEETKHNLGEIRRLISQYRPDAKVVFTVSPIPLAASFRTVPCISANAASKAIVRAAVDEYYREAKPTDDQLFYFPSYDIVLSMFNHQFVADRRHINSQVLAFNMKVFEHYFCTPGIKYEEVLKAFRTAQKYDQHVARHGQESMQERLVRLEQARETRKAAKIAARKAARIQERKIAIAAE